MQHSPIDLRREIPDTAWVDGWLNEVDRLVMHRLLWAQSDAGVTGDALEIGAYRGKSAIVIASALRAGETLHVCDLFETEPEHESNRAEHRQWYSALARSQFEDNMRRAGTPAPVVHQCDSRELPSRLHGHSFRFAHIDGAHVFDVASVDIRTVLDTCGENALIVLDDHLNKACPELIAAIWTAVANRQLCPLVLTSGKLYATPMASSPFRERAIETLRTSRELVAEPTNFFGQPVLSIGSLGSNPTQTLRALGSELPGALVRSARHRIGRVRQQGNLRTRGTAQ